MSNKEGSKVKNFFGFIIYFIVKIRDDDIFALGAQLAYYMILSFFPFLIFLLTLIGFSNLDSMEVLGGLRAILPTSAFELIYNIIIEVIEKQNTGLLGASLLLVVWAASSAFRAVIKGVNKAYGIKETRSFNLYICFSICNYVDIGNACLWTLNREFINDIFTFS